MSASRLMFKCLHKNKTMLSKVIAKSVPLCGIYRSYGKNIYRLQKNLQTDLRLLPCNGRCINTSCSLESSKPFTKEKVKDVESEKAEETSAAKTDEKNEKPSKKIEKREKEGLPVKTDFESEQEKERKKDKHWKRYGRQLILSAFDKAENKNRETFLECIRMYTNSPGKKVDRMLFVYAALKHMEDFGVHKDLAVYKAIIDIFPKQTMVPTNVFQTWFYHYPKEQFCTVAILEQMEDNQVIPDPEMESLLLNIFGSHGLPLQKYWKMMYWMPKFKNLNPWPVPKPIPNDAFELAKLAMIKISSIDVQSSLSIFDTNDVEHAIDKTWIVSAMAPKQSELLRKHDKKKAVYVEGPHKIYVATKSVDYFVLKADPSPDRKFPDIDTDAVDKFRNPYLETERPKDLIVAPSVHEEVDATIFAVCATGMSTQDSLLSWIRCLQKTNPVLGELPVVFMLKSVIRENYYIGDGEPMKANDAEYSEFQDSDKKQ